MNMEKMEEFLSTIQSPLTRKSYIAGIRIFETYLNKPIESLIGTEDQGRTIEKFYVHLKNKGYTQNSCRNLVNGAIQFLKFYKVPLTYKKSLGIYRTELTTRDKLVTIAEVRQMAEVASLKEMIILEVYLLGLRVYDACRLKKDIFDISKDAPIPIEILTHKEGVIARTFISQEFKDSLVKYLPLLKKDNPYLLQSARREVVDEDSLNKTLKTLATRAGIDTKGFHWHTGRKLFLRTSAELGITSWNAMMMVGKSVDKSIETYINHVQLKEDFLKVSEVLRFRKPNGNGKVANLEKENQELRNVMKVIAKFVTEEMRKQRLAQKPSKESLKELMKRTKKDLEILDNFVKEKEV
jgi:integrase